MNTKTKGIVSFLVLTFGMSWPLAAFLLLQFGLAPDDTRLAAPFGFAPALAAIIVRKWITREGFADAGLRPNLRKTWPYYLIAWLLPLVVAPIILALVILLGLSQPDFTYQRAFTAMGITAPALFSMIPPPLPLLLIPLIGTFIFWGEEFGWRSYLQIRLFAERPVLAAVATGVIWGLWHAPLILAGLNYPDNPVLGLFLFPVTTSLWSIIFGWLRLRTDSIWSASLAHAATNSVGGTWLALLFYGGPNWTFVSYGGVIAWIPLSVICAWIIMSGRLTPAETYRQQPVYKPSAG